MAGTLSTWSLWLEPDAESKSIIQGVIKSLSEITPPSPSFGPHATLYGSVDIAEDVSAIRARLVQITELITGPLHLSLLPPTTGSTFFQSILAPVKPSDDLLVLKKACDDIWGETKPFFPHVSLKYGFIDQARREEVAEVAREKTLPQGITGRGISIVRCVGAADEWEVVDFVPFR